MIVTKLNSVDIHTRHLLCIVIADPITAKNFADEVEPLDVYLLNANNLCTVTENLCHQKLNLPGDLYAPSVNQKFAIRSFGFQDCKFL